MIRKFAITTALIFLVGPLILAQNNATFQSWNDFNPRIGINDHFMIVGDVGYRFEPSSSTQTFLIRGALRYMPSKLINVDIGIAEYFTWEPKNFIAREFRTFEYIFLNWPRIGNFKFKHRFGLDQRWFRFPGIDFNEFVHRARFRFGVTSPEFKLLGSTIPFYFTGNVEFLRDVNDEDFAALISHNRFMLGLGSNINEKLRAEAQFQVIALSDPDARALIRDADVLRIRVFYKFR